MGKLGIYLMANYPSRETFLEAVKLCATQSVDFLEVGFPFSDPVADGESLERAAYQTLVDHRLKDFFSVLEEARKVFPGRIYVMTYANIVYSMGITEFAARAGRITGLILADVPLRELSRFDGELKRCGLSLIRFLTPESREGDIEAAARGNRDFIYFVSKRGTTGGPFALDDERVAKIAKARRHGAEVYVGFGISGREDVRRAWEVADGAIIGTAAVSALEKGIATFESFLLELQ